MKFKFISCMLLLLISNNAFAALETVKPEEICKFMEEDSMPTRGWNNSYENHYRCSSDYKELGTGFPLANNLAFYAEGNQEVVTRTWLVLNINNQKEALDAHAILLTSAEKLIMKAARGEISSKLRNAIIKGKNNTDKIGNSLVKITRDNWSTGKGYEIAVSIN